MTNSDSWNFTRARSGPSRTYATGKFARATCDRCGWEFDWLTIKVEPGTGWRVCGACNDGIYSLVAHPQNYPANGTDAVALPWTRPDQSPDITQPYYLATEDGYVIVWDQNYIIQTGTSAASGGVTQWPNELNWESGPFGYE